MRILVLQEIMCFFIVRMPWLKAEDLFCCCWNKGFDLITGATSRLPLALGFCGLVALRKSSWEEQSAAGASQGRHSQVSRANQPLSRTLWHDTKGKAIAGSQFLLQCGLTFSGGHAALSVTWCPVVQISPFFS